MVNTDDNYLGFKFWNLTMKLFHLLGFTKELVFGSSTSVTILNSFFVCFIDGSRFFKAPEGLVSHTFEAFSKGCILSELINNCFLRINFSLE